MAEDLPSIEDLLTRKTGAVTPTSDESVSGKAQAALSAKVAAVSVQGREDEARSEAAASGVQYVDLKGFPISPDALSQISDVQAQELQVICFLYTGPQLRIAAVNPMDQKVKDLLFQLEERNKAKGAIYQISPESFAEGFKLYSALPKIRKVVKGVQIKQEELAQYQSQMNSFDDIAKILAGANITDILAIVIAAALKMRSSDIHIEAAETKIEVRLRVDGILQEVAAIEADKWKKMISRIKLIAGLKMNISDRPQDGRFTIFQEGKKIDVRTSTMPNAWGESVVMRILNPDSVQLGFEKLGFRPAMLGKLLKEIDKPHGMVITTGPTGSGKTTTLYAILARLNKPGVNIITLEDPVEFKLDGINQSQIDSSKDYTFAKGLRSILRQDPDIVMVGEIRDLETAETAIQAALTGHLLISTIHTNDAAGAIPRFVSMGVKPFLLAPAINAIMGQRLARKLCEQCKVPLAPTEDQLVKINELLSSIPESSGEPKVDLANLSFFGPGKCDECNNTGYKGRLGLYEILLKDQAIEQFILSGEISEFAVRKVAQEQGMITMAQDGLLKALEGQTSLEEIQRTTGGLS